MPITPENLPRHELIGLPVEVTESTDKNKEGLSGQVLDETKNTLNIGGKIIDKENCTFLFTLPSGEKVELDGGLIAKRPEERVKMKLPGKWS
ncbi:ribonuclease P protein component 1 [Candidatus Nanosalina sp. VS9-1]|uniref:ribonuclease P protein component 1 n=1 Tax=Candidatus Nanosalina sp. VS9-1 TaxID=3388566 RepID=UPI0039E119E8